MKIVTIEIKSMRKLLSAAVCLMLLTVNGFSQTRWKLVGFDSRRKPFYIDQNFQRQPDGTIVGWQKTDLPSNITYPVGAYFVTKTEWNCDNRMSRDSQIFVYDQRGEFIEKLDTGTSWKSNPPESIGEIIIESVCGTLQKKKNYTTKVATPSALFAQIIVKKADLMSAANSKSEVIRRIALNEKLVMVGDEPVGVWYQVIDAKTNSAGWLNGNNFRIVKAKKPNITAKKKTRRR